MSLTKIAFRTIAVLAVSATLACHGDPGYSMRIENNTDVSVTVYELGAYQTGADGFDLTPGEHRITYWFRPRDERDDQLTIVKALDKSGTVVFCRPYSYALARDNLRWTVSITRGIDDCT